MDINNGFYMRLYFHRIYEIPHFYYMHSARCLSLSVPILPHILTTMTFLFSIIRIPFISICFPPLLSPSPSPLLPPLPPSPPPPPCRYLSLITLCPDVVKKSERVAKKMKESSDAHKKKMKKMKIHLEEQGRSDHGVGAVRAGSRGSFSSSSSSSSSWKRRRKAAAAAPVRVVMITLERNATDPVWGTSIHPSIHHHQSMIRSHVLARIHLHSNNSKNLGLCFRSVT